MLNRNYVELAGNVGKDPDIRYLDNKTCVAKFPLASNETYKNKAGEKVTVTEWHNIVMWNKPAELAEQYIRKGTGLFLTGKIKTRSWEDDQGVKKYATEIHADHFQFTTPAQASNQPQQPTNDNAPSGREFPDNFQGDGADDLPF